MTKEERGQNQPEEEQSFVSHLVELRGRLLRAILSILVITVGLLPFAQEIYTTFAGPLLQHMPEGSQMIAIDPAAPFFTPFKLTLYLALFLSIPVILYQIWAFIAPALYRKEKRLAVPLLISSTLLFYLGCFFAYMLVLPLIFGFFTSVVPEGVAVMTDITRYLDFVIVIFFAFGIAFEVPIATIILVATGMTTPDALAKKRAFVIVGSFAVGMILTPPDLISQTLLAVPMWVLFEIGIVMARILVKKKQIAVQD